MEFFSFDSSKVEMDELFQLHLDYLIALSHVNGKYYAIPTALDEERKAFDESIGGNALCLVARDGSEIVGYLVSYPCETYDDEHYVYRRFAFLEEAVALSSMVKPQFAAQADTGSVGAL